MNSRTKDWFDAVSNGNIDQMQRLIRDEMPLDTVNEVLLSISKCSLYKCSFIAF